MNNERLRALLARVREGEIDVPSAMEELRSLPLQGLDVATVDMHRALRLGVPEVIYGAGKTAEQIVAVARALVAAGHDVLATRVDPEKAEQVRAELPEFRYDATSRLGRIVVAAPIERPCAPIAVVCAGTSDLPVAEEAALTLQAVGLTPRRVYDVGVAGIHRLFDRIDELRAASAAIVVAGMEGALPSVVGGIVACPIVAVPVSIGYGTALGGFTALFAMLTSCAPGITVVNIDNGFGAAMAVHRMLPKAT